jgi:hypothetical protein
MALDRNGDFIDTADEADARRQARRVTLMGVLVAFVLGFGLVSLLVYGRILTDDAAVVSVQPSAVTVPAAPTPKTP